MHSHGEFWLLTLLRLTTPGARRVLALTCLAALPLTAASAAGLSWRTFPGGRIAPVTVGEGTHVGFTRLTPAQTGISFTNRLSDARAAENQIRLNGSGVALGDFDGDGVCDIYLCGLEAPNGLFRNLGNGRFEDVTTNAGVACEDHIPPVPFGRMSTAMANWICW